MPENIDKYLSDANFDNDRIAQRFRKTLKAIYDFLNVKGVARSVVIDYSLLKTATLDYFVDIARIEDYHDIDKINFAKIYGYMAYWLLKRKPLLVKTPFQGSEFVNELFVATFLISNMLSEKHLRKEDCSRNAKFNEFQSLLFYNLKYRPVYQQSLELMIEAFFCACDFT